MRRPSPTLLTASGAAAPSAPAQAERVRLRDGSCVTLRPVRLADEAPLRVFLGALCPEARRLRYFSGAVDLLSAAHWAAETPIGRFGLLAHDDAGVLVAHATYVQLNDTHAEVAVEVADHLHGLGLGTILVERLALHAEEHRITYFVAEVLAENHAMLDVFRDGFDAHVGCAGPEERIEFLTSRWRIARERFDAAGS